MATSQPMLFVNYTHPNDAKDSHIRFKINRHVMLDIGQSRRRRPQRPRVIPVKLRNRVNHSPAGLGDKVIRDTGDGYFQSRGPNATPPYKPWKRGKTIKTIFQELKSNSSSVELEGITDLERLSRYTNAFSIVPGPNSTAFQDQMVFSYFFTNYHWAQYWRPVLQLSEELEISQMGYICSAAIAYGYIGRELGEERLQHKGWLLHGQGLRYIQSIINNGTKDQLASSCVTIILLGMYQYALGSNSYIPHYSGISDILRFCGPTQFQSQNALRVFRSCRILMICHSFLTKKRPILADEQWITIPFAKQPKTTLDMLVDIFLELPELSGTIEATTDITTFEVNEKLTVAIDLLWARLVKWRVYWENRNSGTTNEVLRVSEYENCLEPGLQALVRNTYSFQTTRQALEIVYYNSAYLYLTRLQSLLPRSVGQPQSHIWKGVMPRGYHKEGTLLMPWEISSPIQPTLEILRTLPYLMENVGSKDGFIGSAALGVLYFTVRDVPECKALMGMLEMMPQFRNADTELAVFDPLSNSMTDIREMSLVL